MSDISTVGVRYNGADMEWFDKASGTTVFAFRKSVGSLPAESAVDGITAFAGGGQGSAVALTADINRVTTVASPGDSVMLPAALPGLDIIVINHGSNPMQVFGNGSDLIDDQAAATGVSQMQNSFVLYACSIAGRWYSEGLSTGFVPSLGLQTLAFKDAISAAGNSQATGTQLAALMNRVTTVTAGQGANLPASAPGLAVTIINSGANALIVYPVQGGSETINGNAAATGVLQIAGSAVTYMCTVAGIWIAMGIGNGYNGQYPSVGAQDGQTALGSTRGTAFAIAYEITRFSTVAASTGAVLPASAAGLSFTIINAGANSLTVYATGADTINGTAGATGIALASGKTATYFSASTGTWHSILSA